MAINFHKEEDLSPESAFMAYKQLVDYHLYFLKQQSKCEFLLQGKGFVLSPFIGIVLTGVGVLLMLLQNMRMDFEYGVKAAACVEKGLRIQKKHDYPAKLFSIFEDNKLVAYRGNLLSRLFPTGLIGLATGGAATLLAMKIGTWLTVAVVVLSLVSLCISARLYIKIARKILLND